MVRFAAFVCAALVAFQHTAFASRAEMSSETSEKVSITAHDHSEKEMETLQIRVSKLEAENAELSKKAEMRHEELRAALDLLSTASFEGKDKVGLVAEGGCCESNNECFMSSLGAKCCNPKPGDDCDGRCSRTGCGDRGEA
eukprot:gnl/TRDRNA2_/TRDRNA2_181981_c0_seq1.p1 gnl/TRDRNA2_/TRDRNA2_181981_c0~~gnl/TRDRNA2_/TRDRNA2_181981_c0_seq1.p1  ORF type:complete len:141 (+),score=33.11 gnl/TRDRNA2_/TRDRNA2_181981_c0_seq1:170-592(+)